MKVLVTGATGFIGNYVIPLLLSRGHSVVATSSNREKAIIQPWFDQVIYYEFDFTTFDDQQDYYGFFERPDLMIHLAWEGLPNYKAAFHEEVNFPRHFAFIRNMIRHGLNDITITGTCFEYGMQEGCLREDMEVKPANPYARAKDQLRRSLEQLQNDFPFVLKWARLFYMYGKGQHPNSLLSQLERALENGDEVFNMSGGEQVRDFLPVEEMAERIVKIALQQDVKGIINCCSGKQQTVRSLVENYLAKKGQHIKLNLGYYPYPDYEPMRFWGDTSQIQKILNNE